MSDNRYTRRAVLSRAGVGGLGALGMAIPIQQASSAGPAASPAPSWSVDVLVCGGGPAGMAAAAMAARSGRKVLLVERYGRMGGMAVQALVGPLMGSVRSVFVDDVLRRVGGRHCDTDRLDLQYAAIVRDAGAKLLLHSWAADVTMRERAVAGVRLVTKQGLLDVAARVVVDATGDGDIAAKAGAAFEFGRPGDGLLQPVSIMYRLAGVDEPEALICGSEEQAKQVRVPEGPWCDVVANGQKDGELAATIGIIRLYKGCRPGERVVNATQINGIDGTKVEDLTRAELEARQQAYQVLDFVRKHAPGYAKAYITCMPASVGVRETRRVLGAEYLTREHVTTGRKWPDAVVRNASFPIDIHNPAGHGQAEGFAAQVKPYDIPYGCLVPRAVDGLLVAGRCISGSHDAHASYRVQCIAMALGAAAGAAAACAVTQNVEPRKVDVEAVRKALG